MTWKQLADRICQVLGEALVSRRVLRGLRPPARRQPPAARRHGPRPDGARNRWSSHRPYGGMPQGWRTG